MRKAFTLSEALITLAIIGVLASILVPTVNNVRPDKDKVTYKKALYSMQTAVSNAMETSVYTQAVNSAAYWKDETVEKDDFCKALADTLNTKGAIKCSGTSSYTNPNFVTTDGIRYWGLENGFTDGGDASKKVDTKDICVDRMMGASEVGVVAKKRNAPASDPCKGGMRIRVRYDGKVMTDDSFTYENDLIDNSFDFKENH